MNRYANRTPEGTRDLLFEECCARRKVERALSELFQSRGFSEVVTPTLEFFDVFNRESAGRLPESLYSLSDSQGRLLVLRADSTLPIARVAATRLRETAYPLRLYYNQSVFRRNPRYAGLDDETFQGGIELIGASGFRADLEVLLTAVDALDVCGAPDFRIEIGHAGFFSALTEQLQADAGTRTELCALIEAKNYGALNDLLDTMEGGGATDAIRRLPRLFGGEGVLEKAEALSESPKAREAVAELHRIWEGLQSAGLAEKVSIDFGLVHGGNYYTGMLFRGYIDGSGQTVLSGGRYDCLLGEFGKALPAIGFGVEVAALAAALRDETLAPRHADVLVFGEVGCELQALLRVKEQNALGLTAENSLAGTREEALAYAKRKGISCVEIIDAEGVRNP